MTKKAIIIGARADGHAKVVLHILLASKEAEVIGFVDDDISKKNLLISGLPVLGQMSDIPDLKSRLGINAGIVAIGHNAQRRELADKLKAYGLELINAIHPSVIIDGDVEIGKGNYLAQGVILVTGTKVGNCVNIHTGTTIDHDNVLEDGVNIGPGVHTAGRVHIEQDAFLGTGCNVIPDIKIGKGAILGAGTVVIRNVRPSVKMVGNPAQEIKI
jgi:sugar O-acyltransferase (sialic acid O-acetyltransferase NeuD family)